jgi:long-chain acyl-CoA synthetase
MVQVKNFADSHSLSQEDAMKSKELKEQIMKDMDAKAKEYALNSLEKVKALYLTAEPFSVENDIITPTFKIKRNIAKKVFKEQIDKMYEESNDKA